MEYGDAAIADDYRDYIFGAAVYRVCVRDEVSGGSGRENCGRVRAVNDEHMIFDKVVQKCTIET
ncbi:MAG: hypothetical protein G01um101416_923 [Microgenomates group bacterium Gr01-1014_16]|nr:MAG: hypothetical protein G01um101416_923 [Microgenomates group bacterium Gr01-1014_16]